MPAGSCTVTKLCTLQTLENGNRKSSGSELRVKGYNGNILPYKNMNYGEVESQKRK